MTDRALVFIDGNNWYHYLKWSGVEGRFQVDYAKISKRLLGPRQWIGTRYYIGRVDQRQGAILYADQRRFVASLQQTDSRITVHFGRIEARRAENVAAREIQRYLHSLSARIDQDVFRGLLALAKSFETVTAWVEKAVDVNLAIDMVAMACRNQFDAGYLLSADGDFTSAVQFVRDQGKRLYVASPGHGAQLAKVASSFVPLKPEWFADCYR